MRYQATEMCLIASRNETAPLLLAYSPLVRILEFQAQTWFSSSQTPISPALLSINASLKWNIHFSPDHEWGWNVSPIGCFARSCAYLVWLAFLLHVPDWSYTDFRTISRSAECYTRRERVGEHKYCAGLLEINKNSIKLGGLLEDDLSRARRLL